MQFLRRHLSGTYNIIVPEPSRKYLPFGKGRISVVQYSCVRSEPNDPFRLIVPVLVRVLQRPLERLLVRRLRVIGRLGSVENRLGEWIRIRAERTVEALQKWSRLQPQATEQLGHEPGHRSAIGSGEIWGEKLEFRLRMFLRKQNVASLFAEED